LHEKNVDIGMSVERVRPNFNGGAKQQTGHSDGGVPNAQQARHNPEQTSNKQVCSTGSLPGS
jgi:hypothetical protein